MTINVKIGSVEFLAERLEVSYNLNTKIAVDSYMSISSTDIRIRNILTKYSLGSHVDVLAYDDKTMKFDFKNSRIISLRLSNIIDDGKTFMIKIRINPNTSENKSEYLLPKNV